jgi:hypothetical protein
VYDAALYIPNPNYIQKPKDICIGMTLSAISTTSSLDIVPFLGCGYPNMNNLPSWCPNWFNMTETLKRQIDYLLNGTWKYNPLTQRDDGYWTRNSYEAAGSTDLSLRIENSILWLRRIMLDEIDGIVATNPNISAPPMYEDS